MRPLPVGRDHGEWRTARDVDNVVPFRRRQLRRSRRSPLAKWLPPLLLALAIVGVPTGAVAWIMTSPRFALAEVSVTTGERVPEAWVRAALAPFAGRNLPLLPLDATQQRLLRHPWIRGADLRKDLPAGLAVRVTEKRAVALLRDGKNLHYLDARGESIAPLDPLAGRLDLVLLSRAASGDAAARPAPVGEAATLVPALRLLEELDQVRPSWVAGLSEIEILGEKDFRVHTASLPSPLLVRAGTLHLKARRLEELLPRIVERYGAAAAIDLRFARRIIVQPSARGDQGPRPPVPAAANREARADHAQRG